MDNIIKYIKWFLISLLLYFLVYNILRWKFDLYSPILTVISARKELSIWIGIYYIVRLYIWSHINFKKYISDGLLEFIVLILSILLAYSFVMSFIVWSGIKWFVFAVRYEFLWYIVFALSYVIWSKIKTWEIKHLDYRYTNLIKRILVLSVLRYTVIVLKPQAIKVFWYDHNVYEWIIWAKPPAAYYSHLNEWAVRNQFLFERPIYYGFWLIMFWPMFYLLELKWKKYKDTWLWWWLYIFAVVTTFGRGAWLAFMGQSILLIYINHHDNIDKIFIKFRKYWFYIIIWLAWFGYIGAVTMFGWGRRFSTTWHINAIVQWTKYRQNAPIFGNGPATAWPASHRLKPDIVSKFQIPGQELLKWFNPENQYLQTLIQFGLIGWLFRFILYIYLNIVWLSFVFSRIRRKLYKIDNLRVTDNINKTIYQTAVWLSVGILWLSFMWLFLGSFSEYTTVYPAMVLMALNLSAIRYWQDNYQNK